MVTRRSDGSIGFEDRTAEYDVLVTMVNSGEPVGLAVDDVSEGEWEIGPFRETEGEIAVGLPLYVDWTMELMRV